MIYKLRKFIKKKVNKYTTHTYTHTHVYIQSSDSKLGIKTVIT